MITITNILIQNLASGKQSTVRIHTAIWDYKPKYLGLPSLHTRSAGYTRIALPTLEALPHEGEEFRLALKIVKRLYELKEKP